MHIHITEQTCKLLDRKIYEIQERSKTLSNGSISMNTYFVLHRKDRLGNRHKRPFHTVLEQLKQQELEEAKQRQSNGLKNTQRESSIKENGVLHSSSTPTSKSTEFTVISTRTDGMNSNWEKSQSVQTSQSKPPNQLANTPSTHTLKSFPGASNSKTCALL